MLRRAPAFQVGDGAVVSSGLMPDRHPLQSPLWVKGENVRFRQGRVERLVPPALVVEGTSPGRGLAQVQTSDGVRWVWYAGSDGDVKRWYGPAAEDIVTLDMEADETLGKPASMVDFTPYGDWMIINSAEEVAQIYKPEGPGDGLADYAPDLGNVLQFQKMLSFVLAIGFDGKSYGWSDDLNIEDWNFGSTTNLAGRAPIEDFNTRIRASSRLGPYISVFAEDQMALIQFIGEPAIFTHSVVLNNVGAVGKAAVTTDGRANYGVGRNGVWRTDGQSVQYIDRGQGGLLQKYLQKNVNWAQASKIVAARNDVAGCIDFHFPMGSELENSEGWSFDPETMSWSRLPPMAQQAERLLFRNGLAIKGSDVVLLDDDPDEEAALLLETKPFLLESTHAGSLIDEADFLLNAASNVQFRLGVSEFSSDDKFGDWTRWQDLHVDTRAYRLDARVSAVYHKLQLRSTADNWDLDLQGFLLYGTPQGSRRDAR